MFFPVLKCLSMPWRNDTVAVSYMVDWVCVPLWAFYFAFMCFQLPASQRLQWLSLFLPGRITLSNWATAVESVLHLGLPWRMLRPQLVRSTADGMLEYKSWLDDLAVEQRSQEVRTRPLPSKHDAKQLTRSPARGTKYGTKGERMVPVPV